MILIKPVDPYQYYHSFLHRAEGDNHEMLNVFLVDSQNRCVSFAEHRNTIRQKWYQSQQPIPKASELLLC